MDIIKHSKQTQYVKNYEEIIYQSVLNGELEIDDNGYIWRVAKKSWDRWNKCIRIGKCKRVRAESVTDKYLIVKVMFDSKRYTTGAHRLVYRHFYGQIPEGMTINHMDGNKRNNHPNNLEIASPSQQALHSLHVLKKGRLLEQSGEKNLMAKLTIEDVVEIRRRRLNGELLKAIAEDYGVSFKTISKIGLNQRWQKD
ncbi:MAG: HNH endonuclease [Microcoleus sp.]